MTKKVYHTSKKQTYETPDWLFDRLNQQYLFTLDVCADGNNHKVDKYFTIEDNALTQNWKSSSVWMNPPYNQCKEFLHKANEELDKGQCLVVVALIPARTDTKWWWDEVIQHKIYFVKGRIKFKNTKHAAPFPSAIIEMKKWPQLNYKFDIKYSKYWKPEREKINK